MTKFQCHSNIKFQFVAHKKKHTPSLCTDDQFTPLYKMIGAACGNRVEEIPAVGGLNAESIHVTTGGTYSYHWTLNF